MGLEYFYKTHVLSIFADSKQETLPIGSMGRDVYIYLQEKP